MKNSYITDTRIVFALVLVCSLYALVRFEVVAPRVVEGQALDHPYDLDAFLEEYPKGFLGMIPSYPAPLWGNDTALDVEVGGLSDPMATSGFAVVFLGLWLSFWMDRVYARLSRQLLSEGVVDWTREDIRRIENLRRRASWLIATGIAALQFTGTLMLQYKGLPATAGQWEFLLSTSLLAALAGHRLGACAAYGRMAWMLAARDRRMTLILGHVDDAGGARVIGEFLALAGVILALPVLWLAFWLALSGALDAFREVYGQWFLMQVIMLGVGVLIAYLGFVGPLFLFTRQYQLAKARLAASWRRKTRGQLVALRQAYEQTEDWSTALDAVKASAAITGGSQRIERLRSVPLRPAVGGVISLAVLPPLGTLLAEVLGVDGGLLGILLMVFDQVT